VWEVILLDNFMALPLQKQTFIIDAALAAFGRNGYKKASTADVAAAAGISKGMVFHYFGTKKDMYLYLCEHCFKTMQKALVDTKLLGGDFFDRIRYSMYAKIAVLKASPHMLEFLKSVFSESDPDVAEELARYRALRAPSQQQFIMTEGDAVKFKPGINPEMVLQMLTWMGVGSAEEMSGVSAEEKLDSLNAAFDECLHIIKNNFYREEYL
jgi:AcrR family transcriptional regulator